ncbi:MAG TPA: endolytic transglycosylase MltG [Candidatus Saccharimonadales bacterium]|nr:endolytic transglycosylase MltG [Candidatus Saccharimonadales bacterium]
MVRYGARKKRRTPRRIWILLAVMVVLAVGGAVIARQRYYSYLEPLSRNQTSQIFVVSPGNSVKEIADNLQTARLIRSSWAFQLYVQRNDQAKLLQAGTYALSPSQSIPDIATTLSRGKVATKLVTILPGRRIDQVRADLINSGFSPSAVDRALEPHRYSDLPALADKPKSVRTLEGLLWPESYQKQPNTDPSVIVRESLIAMGKHLTPDVRAGFAKEGLTTYQGITLASIIEQEVSKPGDRAKVAQVFLSRIKSGSPLEADSTARYGSIAAGLAPNLNYDSPYNTYLHKGWPPSPISTVSEGSLHAALHPSKTHWLYFVSGDDGTTYFSTNLQDHEANTRKYCHKLCNN